MGILLLKSGGMLPESKWAPAALATGGGLQTEADGARLRGSYQRMERPRAWRETAQVFRAAAEVLGTACMWTR